MSPGALSQVLIAFLQGERGKCPQSYGTGQESKPEGLRLSSPHGIPLLNPGFSPAGLDPVAAVPAAPKMPRRLKATLASLGAFMVFCLVTLFVVGKLLGDLSPSDFLSFLHTGPKSPRHSPSTPGVTPPPVPGPNQGFPGTQPRSLSNSRFPRDEACEGNSEGVVVPSPPPPSGALTRGGAAWGLC